MNNPSKEQYARIQRCKVDEVNCDHCFYYNANKNFCERNKFAILNRIEACKHFLFEKGR